MESPEIKGDEDGWDVETHSLETEEGEDVGLISHAQGASAKPSPGSSANQQGLMALPPVVLLMFLLSSSLTLLLGILLGVKMAPSLSPSLASLLSFLPTSSSSSPSSSSSNPAQSASFPTFPSSLGSKDSTISPSTPSSPGLRKLSFLVLGDWGRDGEYNQSLVADAMGRVGQQCNCSFVVSTGDNFYSSGLQDEADPQFDSSFSRVYTAPRLKRLRWYSVLGNHDYVRNAEVQTGPLLRARDWRWHCSRSSQLRLEPPCPAGQPGEQSCPPLLELFFIDTTPLVLKEWGPWGQRAWAKLNFSGLPPDHSTYTAAHLGALKEALAASDARWKAVVGHHPVRSIGVHGDTPDLVERLVPILEAYGVDAYINGHDHCLQFIKRRDSPVYYVTSGAGSQAYREQRTPLPEEGVLFGYNRQGFVNAHVSEGELEFRYHDVDGKLLFSHTTKK